MAASPLCQQWGCQGWVPQEGPVWHVLWISSSVRVWGSSWGLRPRDRKDRQPCSGTGNSAVASVVGMCVKEHSGELVLLDVSHIWSGWGIFPCADEALGVRAACWEIKTLIDETWSDLFGRGTGWNCYFFLLLFIVYCYFLLYCNSFYCFICFYCVIYFLLLYFFLIERN